MSDFAEILRKKMFEKRLKAVDLAEGTKIAPSVISRYLSGQNQPSADNIIAIGNYFDAHPQSLLSSSDAPESPESSRHTSDKDKIIDVQDKLIQSLQKQVMSQSHYINALFKELGEAKIEIKEWEDWKASSKERHAKGKAKANLAIAKNKKRKK